MKGGFFWALMLCLLSVWAVAPAWSDEQNQATASEAASPLATPAAAEPAATAPAPAADAPVVTAPAKEAVAGGVEIKDAVVCQDVANRAPVGSADVFSKDLPKVYCFCRVVGMQGEGAIVHNWYYQGALKSSIKLPVRAPNWRTWSYKAMSPEQAGEWMVEIITESGTPLESVVFMVQ
jgi:hypothetical protein